VEEGGLEEEGRGKNFGTFFNRPVWRKGGKKGGWWVRRGFVVVCGRKKRRLALL